MRSEVFCFLFFAEENSYRLCEESRSQRLSTGCVSYFLITVRATATEQEQMLKYQNIKMIELFMLGER